MPLSRDQRNSNQNIRNVRVVMFAVVLNVNVYSFVSVLTVKKTCYTTPAIIALFLVITAQVQPQAPVSAALTQLTCQQVCFFFKVWLLQGLTTSLSKNRRINVTQAQGAHTALEEPTEVTLVNLKRYKICIVVQLWFSMKRR